MSRKRAALMAIAVFLFTELVAAKHLVPENAKENVRVKRNDCGLLEKSCTRDDQCEGYCDGFALFCYTYSSQCAIDNNQLPFRRKRSILSKGTPD